MRQRARSSAAFAFCGALSVSTAGFAKDELYRVPRTEFGHPDVEGVWDHTDATPLERPLGFDALVITPAQAAEIERLLANAAEDRTVPTEPTEYFNARRMQPIHGELHSSIIVDPADGRTPGTPLFKEWQPRTRAAVVNAVDGPEQRPTSERCLGNPAAQPPQLFNPGTNLRQILQTRDALVVLAEVMGQARVIRLNAQHAPAAVTSWSGDAIGWWEGATLVVETVHFTPADSGRVATGIAFMVSPAAKVVERITRVSDRELSYTFTVEDPTYYTRPWKGETHFVRTDERLFEYACHEANYSLTYILQGGRVRDGQWPPNAAAAPPVALSTRTPDR